jgi:hypothetical protein
MWQAGGRGGRGLSIQIQGRCDPDNVEPQDRQCTADCSQAGGPREKARKWPATSWHSLCPLCSPPPSFAQELGFWCLGMLAPKPVNRYNRYNPLPPAQPPARGACLLDELLALRLEHPQHLLCQGQRPLARMQRRPHPVLQDATAGVH